MAVDSGQEAHSPVRSASTTTHLRACRRRAEAAAQVRGPRPAAGGCAGQAGRGAGASERLCAGASARHATGPGDPRCCSRVRPVWQRKLGEAAPVPRRVARRLQRVLQLAEQPQRGRAAAGEAAVGGRAPWAAGAGDQQVQKVRHSAAGGHGPVVHGPLSDVLTPPVPKQIEAQLRVGTLIVTLGASTGTRELLSSSSTGINRTRTSKATLTERPAPNQPSPASPSPAGSGCWRAPCCGHHAGISMSRV